MKKRLLSFVLAALMIASLLPATALAANIVDSGTCGAEVTWTLDSEGVLTISGSGDMDDSKIVQSDYRSLVKSAVIAEGVTSIGEFAFYKCGSLTSVTIPDSVTSIGAWAFNECTSLTSVTIPDSVTSIGEYAFYKCTSLTSVTIPDSVTSIGDSAFFDCISLTSVTIPNSVTSIGAGAFRYCTSLISVTIPDSVTSIGGYAFYDCKSLTSVTISDGVTYIGDSAFSNCTSLTSVTIPGSVTSIGDDAFSECSSLNRVTISDGVTSIGDDAFSNCKSLTSVTIPNSVTSIGHDAFFLCESLTSVTIPDSVTSIGDGAFSCCTSLTSVTIPDSVTSIGGDAFYNCRSLTSVTIPNSVTSIGDSAFYYCRSLTSVTIPDSVTSIGEWAFADCTSLTDVYYTGTEIAWNKIKISDYNDALKNATIHYFSEWTREKEPTCTEPGSETSVCPEAGCGKTFTREIPALGHSWDEGKVTKPATEAEDGVKTFTCTRCGETKTETIPATGSDVDVTQMFSDVTKNWAYPGIQYCVTHKLMGSTGGDKFAPTMTTTRAQIVQILYNLEGEPKVSGTMPFTDLTQNWYKDAVLWAYQTGVVSGTSATTFAPDLPVTREQIAVILMGYAEKVLGVTRTWTPADLSVYPDAGSVSDWAKDALADAVTLGLISGASNDGQTLLEPQGSATREQVATILMEFCKNVKK